MVWGNYKMFIDRNYSLTESDDFRINVSPFLKSRRTVCNPQFIVRNIGMILTGWQLVEGQGGANDMSKIGNNPSLQVITNFPPMQQSLPNKYNGHTQ